MIDLTSYKEKIIAEEDQSLFEEAASSAASGALRAAFIMVWLSCAESLKRKFRIAQTRDGAAKKVCGEIERREKAHQSVDVYLLDEAKKYGFINDTEHLQLKNIYEMRCIYGHPYEKAPSEIELLAATEKVISIVLSQQVRLRHGFLDNQAKLLTQNRSYLDDDLAAVKEYSKEIISRADPELLEWWCEKILQGIDSIKSDPNLTIMVKRGFWVIESVLQTLSPTDFQKWNIENLLLVYPDFSPRLMVNSSIFPHLSSKHQDIVIGTIIESADTKTVSFGRIQSLEKQKLLNERQRERFVEAIANAKLESLSKAGIELRFFWNRIIEDLKSRNWYVQNPAIKALRQAGSLEIQKLQETEQTILGNNVLQAADGGANDAVELVAALSKDEKNWPRAFVLGLVAECFVNDRNQLRFKCDRMKSACLALLSRTQAEQESITSAISEKIRVGTPKYSWSWQQDKVSASEIFQELKPQDSFSSLQAIKDRLDAIVVPKEE